MLQEEFLCSSEIPFFPVNKDLMSNKEVSCQSYFAKDKQTKKC